MNFSQRSYYFEYEVSDKWDKVYHGYNIGDHEAPTTLVIIATRKKIDVRSHKIEKEDEVAIVFTREKFIEKNPKPPVTFSVGAASAQIRLTGVSWGLNPTDILEKMKSPISID